MTVIEQTEVTATRSKHRADVQGLRGIAVIAVVVFHVNEQWLSGGYLGVDVFLVVSGFVIGSTLLRESERTGRIDLREFYSRRVKRLLPALSITLTGTLLLIWAFVPADAERNARSARKASLLTANHDRVSGDRNAFDHTWSLSLEEQFYLVLPVMLAVFAVAQVRHRFVVAAIAVLLGVSLLYSLDRQGYFAPVARFDRSLPGRAWQFLVGVLLAFGAATLSRYAKRGVARPIAALSAVVMVGAFVMSQVRHDPSLSAITATLAAAGIIAAGTAASTSTRWLTVRHLTWIGDRSYGWYLLHWPAIYFADVLVGGTFVRVIAVGLALGGADVMYRRIEEPVRHAALSGRQTVRLAALCVCAPVVLGLAMTA